MTLVVAGTDTGAGKTLVSAVLLARYGRAHRLAYWKPVATGASRGTDSATIRRWVGDLVEVLPETYRFDPPVSPHLAARLAGEAVNPERILEDLVRHGLEDRRRNLVIEGAGGLLVPLNDHGSLLVHLLQEMHLPCVLVGRSTLGTINHTLLSLEALRHRNVQVAAVVLSGLRDTENRAAVERFGRVGPVLELDRIPRPGPASVRRAARRFDRRGHLRKYFE